MIEHCLYGVKVRTPFELFDRNIPHMAEAPGAHPGITLHLSVKQPDFPELPVVLYHCRTHGRQIKLCTDRPRARNVPGQHWRFEVEGVASLTWRGGTRDLQYQLHDEGNLALLAFWFIHIFLPLHLSLERGYDFIHSAGVEVANQPILFIAPSMGGKSTLADYFLKQGHPMLSDDKVATFLRDGQYWAVPSHPHHRPYREHEVLGFPLKNFACRARPIKAFYILAQGEPDSDVQINEVTGFRKFQELLPNYLYNFDFLLEQRLRWLAQLADQSLVFKVHRPWKLERMHEVYSAICAHSHALRV